MELLLDADSRVMVLAPHPDDDTLAAGGVLQRTRARGGAVRVLFATRGENNPWTQRLVERRLRIGPADRARFGERRRGEALEALARLGVEPSEAQFLDLPDQGIGDLLLSGGAAPVTALAAAISSWGPGILIVPSPGDLHPDHGALAILALLALDRLRRESRPALVLQYVVHAVEARPERADDRHLPLTPVEQEIKRTAIRCHATQLAVHPTKFMSFAGPREVFALCRASRGPGAQGEGGSAGPPLGGDGALTLVVRPRARPGAFGRPRLRLLAVAGNGDRVACSVELHRRSGQALVRRSADGMVLGTGTVTGPRADLTVRLPFATLPAATRLFTKIERPFGFFDEAGWTEAGVGAVPSEGDVVRRTLRAGDRRAVACVIPCYNVAAFCVDVVRGAAAFSDQVLVVDDGSSDGTRQRLEQVAAASGGRVRLTSFPRNRGKGVALVEGIRAALANARVAVVVTLDGDGQHRPEDIPALLGAWRDGADLVIGARGLAGNTPLRSRIGNSLIRGFLRRLYPACPADTQSGFRALDRAFAEQVTRRVAGARYETETHMLLLAMDDGHPIATAPIPTIYADGNRSSHFRPFLDSVRIGLSVLRWKMSQGGAAASESAPTTTTPAR